MHPWLHNNYLKFLDPWALGPHHPRFLLKNHWILSLVVYTTFKLHWNLLIFPFLAWNHGWILKYLSLKIRSEPFFQFSKMAAPSCIDNEVKSLAFSFLDFFWARLWRIFENVMSLQGDSPKIEDSPRWNLSPSRFRTFFWARLWRIFENVMSLQGDSPKIEDSPRFRVRFRVVTFVTTP